MCIKNSGSLYAVVGYNLHGQPFSDEAVTLRCNFLMGKTTTEYIVSSCKFPCLANDCSRGSEDGAFQCEVSGSNLQGFFGVVLQTKRIYFVPNLHRVPIFTTLISQGM